MIIKKLKETLGQVFNASEETGNWTIECDIDGEKIDCSELEAPVSECGPGHFTQGYGWLGNTKEPDTDPYVGVPAPEENVIDEWFADRTGEVVMEDLTKFAGNYEGPLYAPYTAVDAFKQESIGDDGTHQRMYEMATKSWNTIDEYTGGSENFQEGPGGWNSGTGWGQVKK